MTSLEELIVASLRARAGADVDPAPLVAAATRRGRSRRRRHYLRVITGFAALAVLVTAATVAGSPGWLGGPAGIGFALPDAFGVPGALGRPELVASDPHVLHFDAPELTAGAQSVAWEISEGVERLRVSRPGGGLEVTIARDLAALTAAMAGNRRVFGLVDEVDGVPVAVAGDDRDRVAGAVRHLDLARSQRCVLPIRLTVRPPGSVHAGCQVAFREGRWAAAGITLRDGTDSMWLTILPVPTSPPPRLEANDRLGGRATYVSPDGLVITLFGVNGIRVTLQRSGRAEGFTAEQARTVLRGVSVAADLNDVRTWPPV